MQKRMVRPIVVAVAAAAMGCAAPAVRAETVAEIEAMSDRSADEEAGTAEAQAQQARGAFLEALATLERVLAEHPKSRGARLLHAFYLCKVDDRLGGAVEIGKLRAKDYPKELFADVKAQCGLEGAER